MATRQSIDECIQKCEDAIREGQKQYQAGLGQEHYGDSEYTQAMQKIEESVNDLAQLSQSANAQQREQLHRMRLQVQHLQNEMILLEHDPSTVGGPFIEETIRPKQPGAEWTEQTDRYRVR
ncbi:DUF2524 family protein [Rossellomorea marisflavi]|nr:DUF2524 family protein [Rossellomorea marisflavi]